LDPYFLLSLAEEYLQFISFDNIVDSKESPGGFVIKGNKLLETITKQIPGLLPAHLLLAKGKLAVGDTASSMKSVNKVVEMDPKNEEAYIIHAIISIKSGNPNVGLTFLQQGIANNFQIRTSPLFLLYKGQLEYEAKDYTTALQTLEQAYDLPGIRDKSMKKVEN
jgi:tetratricopeptide repeat protein 21B